MGFLDFLPIIGKVVDRILPDPAQKAAAQLELAKLAQTGELEQLHAEVALAQGQTDTNKAEAANPAVFVSGWRPGAGWVAVTGMALAFIIAPMFTWISAWISTGLPGAFPIMDTGTLMTMLLGMLGLGGLRTWEKTQGVARVK